MLLGVVESVVVGVRAPGIAAKSDFSTIIDGVAIGVGHQGVGEGNDLESVVEVVVVGVGVERMGAEGALVAIGEGVAVAVDVEGVGAVGAFVAVVDKVVVGVGVKGIGLVLGFGNLVPDDDIGAVVVRVFSRSAHTGDGFIAVAQTVVVGVGITRVCGRRRRRPRRRLRIHDAVVGGELDLIAYAIAVGVDAFGIGEQRAQLLAIRELVAVGVAAVAGREPHIVKAGVFVGVDVGGVDFAEADHDTGVGGDEGHHALPVVVDVAAVVAGLGQVLQSGVGVGDGDVDGAVGALGIAEVELQVVAHAGDQVVHLLARHPKVREHGSIGDAAERRCGHSGCAPLRRAVGTGPTTSKDAVDDDAVQVARPILSLCRHGTQSRSDDGDKHRNSHGGKLADSPPFCRCGALCHSEIFSHPTQAGCPVCGSHQQCAVVLGAVWFKF